MQTGNVDFDNYAKKYQTSLEEGQNLLPIVLDKLSEHSGTHSNLNYVTGSKFTHELYSVIIQLHACSVAKKISRN